MNNKVNDKTYIKLTPFKGWVLENFPFIESDFDCITNYQLLCKITEYLNNVISNQNQAQQLGTELVTAYNQLLDYVNNYFNNLDVQEEINNKLDNMAEDGTLTQLIGNYINPLIDEQNSRITSIENTVNNITNWTPIPVESIDDMTDTNRIYLLVDTGYWYYHNGTTWVQGAKYQTISEIYDYFLIDNNAIPNSKTIGDKINDLVETKNYFNKNDYIDNYYYSETGELVSNDIFFITNMFSAKNGDKLLFLYNQVPRHAFQLIKVTNTGAFISRTDLNVYVKSITEDGFYRIVVRKNTSNDQVEITNINLFAIYKNIPEYSLADYKYNLKIQKYVDTFNKFLNDNTKQYNYFDYSSSLNNRYIDDTNRLMSSNAYIVTNTIKVSNGDTLYINYFGTGSTPNLFQAWEYNENMQPLQRVSSLTNSYTASHNGYVTFNIEKRGVLDIENTVVISKNEIVNQFYPFRKYIDSSDGETSPVNINKIDSNNYKITFGDFNLTLFYTSNENANQYNWNIKNISKGNNVLVPTGTDILGPVKINDNTDFIGGVHGDETTDNITIGINGSSYDLSEISEINGENITIIMKSSVYDQNTHIKTFDRYVTIYIAKNYIRVNNSYKTIQACTLKRATNGGLIACYNSIIKDIMFNNAYFETPPTTSQVISSPYNTTATINTIYGSITLNNIIGKDNKNYRGLLETFHNENPIRNKIYFDIYKNGNYSLNVGDMIIGQFEYLFS